jgi:hypothetical protein
MPKGFVEKDTNEEFVFKLPILRAKLESHLGRYTEKFNAEIAGAHEELGLALHINKNIYRVNQKQHDYVTILTKEAYKDAEEVLARAERIKWPTQTK